MVILTLHKPDSLIDVCTYFFVKTSGQNSYVALSHGLPDGRSVVLNVGCVCSNVSSVSN